MNISVRYTAVKYAEVIVRHDNVEINLGLLNAEESEQLAESLTETISELLKVGK